MGTTLEPGTINGPLESDEAQFIASLTSDEAAVTIDDGQPMDPDRLWDNLDLCLRVHRKAERVVLKIRPLIGKFLLMAKDNPEVYERHGFQTYSDFINLYVQGKMGLSRSALYETRLIASRLPSITPEQYEHLGPTKALTLAQYTRSSDPSFPKYLAEAESRTATDFIKWSESQGMIEDGQMDAACILIHTNKTIEKEWEQFIADAAIQAHVGSDKPGDILRSMIMESWFWSVPEKT